MSTTQHTRWKLFTGSEEAWEAMLSACENATTSIDLELFIFVDDAIGKRFIDVCAKRAHEGVQVRFLWDAAGSFSFFGSAIAEDLKKKGIELLFFKRLIPGFFNLHNYRSWYLRNHRRTLVVDGKIGFTGSIGIWEKMRDWRETHMEVEGPVVTDMQVAFEKMWNRALKQLGDSDPRNRKPSRKEKRLQKKSEKQRRAKYAKNNGEFIYETNDPLPRKRYMYYRLIDAIRNSRKSVHITTPYFVPTVKLARVLRLAAHRGVDVRIILPKVSDHPLVDLAATSYFQKMLDAGVKIFFYRGDSGHAMIHSKTIIVDEEWASVGTLNMDTISLLYNFEANIVSTNLHFVNELSESFWADIRQSDWLDPKTWENRIFLQKIPEFLITFIRKFL